MKQEFDFSINRMKLVEAIEQTPEMISKAASLLSEAKAAIYAHEDQMRVARAQLQSDVRESPKEFGLEKVTEAAIKEVCDKSPKLLKMETELNRLKFQESDAHGALEALRAKVECLKMLSSLHGTLWFSDASGRPGKENLEGV